MMKRPILKNLWAIKITIITFVLAILFSFLSQIATSSSQLFVPYMVLIFMIFISIITDAIAVSVTSCDVDRLFFLTKGKNFEYEIILTYVKKCVKRFSANFAFNRITVYFFLTFLPFFT